MRRRSRRAFGSRSVSGTILPLGEYDATEAAAYGTSVGHNVWDFMPTVAVTYTTPP